MIDFNRTFTKIMQLRLAIKASHRLTVKCRSRSHFTKSNISAIIKPIWTKFSSRMMTPLTTVVAFICAGSRLFTQDNCLLYMDAPTNKPLICGSRLTALVLELKWNEIIEFSLNLRWYLLSIIKNILHVYINNVLQNIAFRFRHLLVDVREETKIGATFVVRPRTCDMAIFSICTSIFVRSLVLKF